MSTDPTIETGYYVRFQRDGRWSTFDLADLTEAEVAAFFDQLSTEHLRQWCNGLTGYIRERCTNYDPQASQVSGYAAGLLADHFLNMGIEEPRHLFQGLATCKRALERIEEAELSEVRTPTPDDGDEYLQKIATFCASVVQLSAGAMMAMRYVGNLTSRRFLMSVEFGGPKPGQGSNGAGS